MLFQIFLFLSKSISKNVIDEDVRLEIVMPDSQMNNDFNQKLNYFKSSLYQHDIYVTNLHLKDRKESPYFGILDSSNINYLILRDERLLKFFIGNINETRIANETIEAKYSHLEFLDDNNIDDFRNANQSYFLLTNPNPPTEFEDIAFLYYGKKVKFGYKFGANFSLEFHNKRMNVSRYYDIRKGTSLLHFVKSCKLLSYKTKDSDYTSNEQIINRFKSLGPIKLTALTDNFSNDALSLFSKLKNTYVFENFVDFNVSNWEEGENLSQFCSISKNNLSYVAEISGDCFIFPDVDVISPELLLFWLQNIMMDVANGEVTQTISTEFSFGSNHVPQSIPDNSHLIVIYIENSNSFSLFNSRFIYQNVKDILSNEPIMFLKIPYNSKNHKFPTSDGFPLILCYHKNDRQPYVYKSKFEISKIKNWILKHKEESDNNNMPELKIKKPIQNNNNNNNIFNLLNSGSIINQLIGGKGIKIITTTQPLIIQNNEERVIKTIPEENIEKTEKKEKIEETKENTEDEKNKGPLFSVIRDLIIKASSGMSKNNNNEKKEESFISQFLNDDLLKNTEEL